MTTTVWLLEHDEYPGDYDSRSETLGVYSSLEKVREFYPSIFWVDASIKVVTLDPGEAYAGFKVNTTTRDPYYADYWLSKWELDAK